MPSVLSQRRRLPAWPTAVVGDTLAVLVFAAIGRAGHDESTDAAGVWHTAWPFLLGAALGLAASAVARTSPTSVRAGVRVWVWTLVIGMVVRAATGAGIAIAFVIVAAVVLAALLVGWRALLGWRAVLGRRSRWSRLLP
jgi:FtsH-binding integral membrane protein